MGRRSLLYLVYFSLVPLALLPVWWHTMRVERQPLPEGLELLVKMDRKHSAPRPYAVHEVDASHPLGKLTSWDDTRAVDKLMEAEQDGIFWLKDEAAAPLVVFGSRRQAFVRGGAEQVSYARRVMTTEGGATNLTAPIASRYAVTFSLLHEGGQRYEAWDPE